MVAEFGIAALLGLVLAKFFKVLVLVPACLGVLVVSSIHALFAGHTLVHLAVEFAMLNLALQIGYGSLAAPAATRAIWQRIKLRRMHAFPVAPADRNPMEPSVRGPAILK
jgi:hypothetical protein